MNLYLLLEGKRTEAKIYPSWLACIERPFARMMSVDEVVHSTGRSFFSFSANGYPSIVGHHLENAIQDLKRYPGYDWLVVCLDVDESTAADRISEVEQKATQFGLDGLPVRLFVVAQSRCIESWLLGYPKLIGAAPPSYVAELRDFYDVRQSCPEAMGMPRSWQVHAQFHAHYLKEAFKAKNVRYAKADPGHASTKSYFDALCSRVLAQPGSLPTFRRFLTFITSI